MKTTKRRRRVHRRLLPEIGYHPQKHNLTKLKWQMLNEYQQTCTHVWSIYDCLRPFLFPVVLPMCEVCVSVPVSAQVYPEPPPPPAPLLLRQRLAA